MIFLTYHNKKEIEVITNWSGVPVLLYITALLFFLVLHRTKCSCENIWRFLTGQTPTIEKKMTGINFGFKISGLLYNYLIQYIYGGNFMKHVVIKFVKDFFF